MYASTVIAQRQGLDSRAICARIVPPLSADYHGHRRLDGQARRSSEALSEDFRTFQNSASKRDVI